MGLRQDLRNSFTNRPSPTTNGNVPSEGVLEKNRPSLGKKPQLPRPSPGKNPLGPDLEKKPQKKHLGRALVGCACWYILTMASRNRKDQGDKKNKKDPVP